MTLLGKCVFPREVTVLPLQVTALPLSQKGPYLKLPEKGQNVLSCAVIPYRISVHPLQIDGLPPGKHKKKITPFHQILYRTCSY